MAADLLQGVVSIIVGCLVGTLAYLVPEAIDPRPIYPALPRAVVLVPERMCHSMRCLLSGTTQHLVEVGVLERGTRCMKVTWPRAFRHLDAWIQVADVPDFPSVSSGVLVLEELPAYPRSSVSEFERWLRTVDVELDALDAGAGAVTSEDPAR
jgi:hypothetical protein